MTPADKARIVGFLVPPSLCTFATSLLLDRYTSRSIVVGVCDVCKNNVASWS